MNQLKNQPIGFFDSGLGGLSVVKEVKKILPKESIEYYADNLNQPYGEKSLEQLIDYSFHIMDFLLGKNVKTCVIACNTATAASIKILKKHFTIPIIGMILPAVKEAISKTSNKKIGVIATEFTVKSQVYLNEIKKINPEIHVFSNYCPECVTLVEDGKNNSLEAEQIMQKYLIPLKKNRIDTLIIGCTHYAFLKNAITKYMGNKISLVDPAQSVALELRKVLTKEGILSNSGKTGENYYTSGDHETVEKIAQKILKVNNFHIWDVKTD
jgi:glutamate racemase